MDIANILLRVTGDADDAQREVVDLAGDLAAFDRIRAEAELEVESRQARAELRSFTRQLESIDRTRVNAEVDADIQGALVELALFDRVLDAIDRREVDVDVDVDRLSVARLGIEALRGSLQAIIPNFAELTGGADAGTAAVKSLGINLGPVSARMGAVGATAAALAVVLAIVVAVAVSLAAAVVALVASLSLAVAALGALAIAFGGAALAAVAFGAAFAAAMERGGAVAKAVTAAVDKLKEAFVDATLDGVRAFAAELAPAIASLVPLVRGLRGAFTVFGEAAGQAVRMLAEGLAALGPQLDLLIRGAAELAGPFVEGLLNLLEVLLNIANAAMPLLVEGMQAVADLFGEWARGTSNLEAVRDVIRTMVGHLESWLGLIGAVFDIFKELFGVIERQGKGVVDTLTRGAQSLADWIENNPEEIRQFFADVLPLAGSFLKAVGQLLIAFMVFTQTVAPALTSFFDALTDIFELVNQFGAAALPSFQTLFSVLVGGIWGLQGATTALGDAWERVKGVLEEVFGAIATAAGVAFGVIRSVVQTATSAATGFVTSRWNAARGAVTGVWNGIRTAATAVWGAIRGVVQATTTAATTFVRNAWTVARGTLTGVWNTIRAAAASVWGAIRAAITTAVQAATGRVAGLWRSAAGVLRGIWSNIRSAAASAWAAIRAAVVNAVNQALATVKGLAGQFFAAGKALVSSLAKGILAGAGEVVGAARSVLNSVTSLLPGSEPRDRSSPLANLAARGRAIIENIGRGIAQGGARLQSATRSVLDVVSGALLGLADASTDYARRLRDALQDQAQQLQDRAQDLRAYQEALQGVRRSLQDVAREAVEAFALRNALEGLEASPESQELRTLQADQDAAEFANRMLQQQDRLAAAMAEGDVEAQRQAQYEIARLQRQRRIDQLAAEIAAKKAEIQEKGRLGTLEKNEEVRQYERTLARQLGALSRSLAQREISYRQFVARVNRVLRGTGEEITFNQSYARAIRNAQDDFKRGGAGLIQSLIQGLKSRFGSARETIRELLRDLRRLLPGSEPKDPSSPLRGLAKSGRAIVDNLARGVTGSGDRLAANLHRELTGVHLQAARKLLPMAPAMAAAGETNYNLSVQGVEGQRYPDGRALLGQLETELRNRGGLAR